MKAAHCILITHGTPERFPTLATSISVGSSWRNGNDGVSYRASRLVVHPDYHYFLQPFFIASDIAIIRTMSRIMFGPNVQPIRIASQVVPAGSEVMAIGWGVTGVNEDVSHEIIKKCFMMLTMTF